MKRAPRHADKPEDHVDKPADHGGRADAGPPSAQSRVKRPDAPSDHLCFDRALANVKIIERMAAGSERHSLCGQPGNHGEGLNINFALVRGNVQTSMHASVRLRSPFAIFQYLGGITRSLAAQQPKLQEPGYAPPGSERLLFPLTGAQRACFVRPVYDGRGYCLPDRAFEAKQAVSILTLLLQTDTNRSDLPTSAVSVQF